MGWYRDRCSVWGCLVGQALSVACTQRLEESNLQDYADFGACIDAEGRRAVVGAPNEQGGDGAVYVFERLGASDNEAWSLVARIAGPPKEREALGSAVSLEGDTLAVGAPNADGALFNSGAVYIHQRDPVTGQWARLGALRPEPHEQSGAIFGSAVALHGDEVAVGSPERTRGLLVDLGAVFLFRYGGGTWSQVDLLEPPMPASGDHFGSAVALIDRELVVGASGKDTDSAPDTGAVLVYARNADRFAFLQSLVPIDVSSQDQVGASVALVETSSATRRLVAGAPGRDLGASNVGAAYVFEASGGSSYGFVQGLIASDPQADAKFGSSVATDETRIAVGAPGATGAALRSGAAYTFTFAGVWGEEQRLQPGFGNVDGAFGNATALLGARLLVASAGAAVGTTVGGTVHAYHQFEGRFVHSHALTAQNRRFAVTERRLALDGGRFVVNGAAGFEVYRFDGAGWSLEQRIDSDWRRNDGVAISGNTLAIAGECVPIDRRQPCIRVFSRTGQRWTEELSPELVLGEDQPSNVAHRLVLDLDGDTMVVGVMHWDTDLGRVFVLKRSGGVFGVRQSFRPTVPRSHQFGYAVALDGNTLAFTALRSRASSTVAVYTRTDPTADFVWRHDLSEMAPRIDDNFGKSIALDGEHLATYTPPDSTIPGSPAMLRVFRWSGGMFREFWSSPQPGLGPLDKVGLALSGERLAFGVGAASVGGVSTAGEVRLFTLDPSRTTYVPDAPLYPPLLEPNLRMGEVVVMQGWQMLAAGTALDGPFNAFVR